MNTDISTKLKKTLLVFSILGYLLGIITFIYIQINDKYKIVNETFLNTSDVTQHVCFIVAIGSIILMSTAIIKFISSEIPYWMTLIHTILSYVIGLLGYRCILTLLYLEKNFLTTAKLKYSLYIKRDWNSIEKQQLVESFTKKYYFQQSSYADGEIKKLTDQLEQLPIEKIYETLIRINKEVLLHSKTLMMNAEKLNNDYNYISKIGNTIHNLFFGTYWWIGCGVATAIAGVYLYNWAMFYITRDSLTKIAEQGNKIQSVQQVLIEKLRKDVNLQKQRLDGADQNSSIEAIAKSTEAMRKIILEQTQKAPDAVSNVKLIINNTEASNMLIGALLSFPFFQLGAQAISLIDFCETTAKEVKTSSNQIRDIETGMEQTASKIEEINGKLEQMKAFESVRMKLVAEAKLSGHKYDISEVISHCSGAMLTSNAKFIERLQNFEGRIIKIVGELVASIEEMKTKK